MNEDLHKLIEAAKAIAKENSSAYNEIKKSYVEKEIFRKDSFMKLAVDDDISEVPDLEPSKATEQILTGTATEEPTKQKVPKLDDAEFYDSTIKDLLEIFWNTIDGMKNETGQKIKDLRVQAEDDPTYTGISSLTEFLKKIQFRQVYEFLNSYINQNVQYTINQIYNSQYRDANFKSLPPQYLQGMCKELNTYIRSAYKSLYPPQNQEQLQSEGPSGLQRRQESVGNWSWLNQAKGILNNILG